MKKEKREGACVVKMRKKEGRGGAAQAEKEGSKRAVAQGHKEKKGGQMPATFSLREDRYVARGVRSEGAVPLLVYEIALPAFEGQGRAHARLRPFYAGVAAALLCGCEEALFPFVRRAYAESEDPHKKYRFARYTLAVDFSLDEQGGQILVRRYARLLRRGRVLYERVWEEWFWRESGRMVAPRLARIFAAVRPKKRWKEMLKRAISRHTGGG